jgi:hypothetical protein
MHTEQKEFCQYVKILHPEYFKDCKVLDVGSLDINGNNQYLFENCQYTGIDVAPGNNVHVVSKGHEYNAPDGYYDTIISTECFEHDMYYKDTITNIIRMLRNDGMFLFTCASTGRPEHGTRRTSPSDAPLLTGDWADYYKNLTTNDIVNIPSVNLLTTQIFYNEQTHDLYFYGIKNVLKK